MLLGSGCRVGTSSSLLWNDVDDDYDDDDDDDDATTVLANTSGNGNL